MVVDRSLRVSSASCAHYVRPVRGIRRSEASNTGREPNGADMAVRCGAEIENGRCARARRGLSAATSDGGDGRSWWVGPTSTRLCALGVHTHLDTSRAARAQDARERVLLSQSGQNFSGPLMTCYMLRQLAARSMSPLRALSTSAAQTSIATRFHQPQKKWSTCAVRLCAYSTRRPPPRPPRSRTRTSL